MTKNQTPSRERTKRKTAVAGGGLQRRRFRMFRDCCREGVPAVRQGKGGWEIYRAFSAGARSPAGVARRGRRRSRGGFGVGYLVWGVLMKRSAGIARVR